MSTEIVKRNQELQKRGLPLTGKLTYEQASAILATIWKNAPEIERYKAAMLCADFGLHPLMNHVYLIKFNKYEKGKKVGEDWVTVLGIGATREIYARHGKYSYFDDTPRIMSDDEQKRLLGEVDAKNIVAITRLRNADGMEAQGYGKWPREQEPYGTDKGNSKQNMAMIRSERAAFKRLCPTVSLPQVEVIDEQFAPPPGSKVTVEKPETPREIESGEPPETGPGPETEPGSEAKKETTKQPTKTNGALTIDKVLTWVASKGKTYNRTWFFKNQKVFKEDVEEPTEKQLTEAMSEIITLTGWEGLKL